MRSKQDKAVINEGYKGIKRKSGQKVRKHSERAKKRGLSKGSSVSSWERSV